MGFLSSLFSSSGKDAASSERKSKDDLKNFDLFKYDGIRAMQMRKNGYAIKCFQKALEIQQEFETMHYLVNAYLIDDEPESASAIVDDMLLLEPKNTQALLTKVHLFFHMDREGEAITTCNKIIELEPENYLAWFLRAKAKKADNNLSEAIEDVTGAISIKDDFTDGYLLRSEIFLLLKDGEKALEDANRVIAMTEENSEPAHLLRGRIYEFLDNKGAAANEYREVIELNPFNQEAYLLAGALLTGEHKYDEAMFVYNEAIEHIASFAKAYTCRGKLKSLVGDDQGAAEDLKIASELLQEEEAATEETNFDEMYKGGIF